MMECCIPGANPHSDPLEWFNCDSCRGQMYEKILALERERLNKWIRDVVIPKLESHISDVVRDAERESGGSD